MDLLYLCSIVFFIILAEIYLNRLILGIPFNKQKYYQKLENGPGILMIYFILLFKMILWQDLLKTPYFFLWIEITRLSVSGKIRLLWEYTSLETSNNSWLEGQVEVRASEVDDVTQNYTVSYRATVISVYYWIPLCAAQITITLKSSNSRTSRTKAFPYKHEKVSSVQKIFAPPLSQNSLNPIFLLETRPFSFIQRLFRSVWLLWVEQLRMAGLPWVISPWRLHASSESCMQKPFVCIYFD